jgi:3D (Asp-Asp-Asp) domain-containing protein
VTRLRKLFLSAAISLVLLLNCIPVFAVTPDKVQLERVVLDKTPEKNDLKIGAQGDDVRIVQKLLADSGFYAGEIDGVFGSGTMRAVQDFLAFNNLTSDGVVSKDTETFLRRANTEPSRYRRSLSMVATAYSRFDTGCGSYTARGNLLRKGLVAVDTNVIPLGTRLYILGYGYAVADDTGGAIKGHKIDLAFDSHTDAIQFGVQRVTVYIVD